MPVLRLAIASPLRQLFDYLPPANADPQLVEQLQAGCRIRVPFGRRDVCGVLVEIAPGSTVAADKLRAAHQIIDRHSLIHGSLVELCHWAAGYYKHPIGEILAGALPGALRQGEAHQPLTHTVWQLSVAGKGLPPGALSRAPRQAQLLALLQEQALTPADLKNAGISSATRRQLQEKGLLEALAKTPAITAAEARPGPALNTEQQRAVTAINRQLAQFGIFLLQGVTGSGKTEVYLRVMEQVLARGRQILVLVPEIGLTPQIIQRFQARFAAELAVIHSGLAAGARAAAWEAARCGRAHIVIGTRSAVFASLAQPGLIVIDEEHDSSFKQHEGFRYSARDLAIKRGQLENTPVILGSATPSLESLHNADRGRYTRLLLHRRVGAGLLPGYDILDIRKSALQGGLSEELLTATREQLQAGNQVLLFLNRRGFAPVLQCHDCGYIAGCKHCDARLTVHLRAGELRCHHCDWHRPLPPACPDCRSRQLHTRGIGTEQAETVLRKLFAAVPLHRVDRDSMRRRGAMAELVSTVRQDQPCILLGTQMLSKGHHFPAVTLVGLLDTDASLFSPDFRGPERMGQLLTQVGGRAGRAHRPGRVMLQTHHPDHPLLRTLLEQGYSEFAGHLLDQRRQARFPPFGHIVLMRAEARAMPAAEQFLLQVKSQLQASAGLQVRCIGPLPAPLERKQGRFRAQLLVTGNNRKTAQAAADLLVTSAGQLPAGKRLRWSLDVDPVDMF